MSQIISLEVRMSLPISPLDSDILQGSHASLQFFSRSLGVFVKCIDSDAAGKTVKSLTDPLLRCLRTFAERIVHCSSRRRHVLGYWYYCRITQTAGCRQLRLPLFIHSARARWPGCGGAVSDGTRPGQGLGFSRSGVARVWRRALAIENGRPHQPETM